ncbi:MAG TPA: polyhydroxyalkanoate synthesis regulator DNA-binding domain-containing protein [Acetobacteraceae bacterium]|jgi:polyhydroxyalkanoate synthesis regulator protein|nr:polyhydroxyalkanoate synthesis regulator DNA-binding domain-containing protein [Acetobacteraceae bacterium]
MSAWQPTRPIVVKRYAGSRLYDVANQRYVTAEQLRGWAAEDIAFSVIDAETGDEVTHVLLA